MNTPGIEFGRKTSAAYAALCKPLCQKLHLPQTAFDILMFLANNPGYQTASDVVEMRKLKANLVSVNVDRLVQEGYLVREADPGQIAMDLCAQVFPKVMGDAASAARHTTARRAVGGAARGADRLVDRQDNVRHDHLARLSGQPVTAARSTHALDQTALAQAREQLLKIAERDFLTRRDFSQGDGPIGPVFRQIGHRHDCVTSLGRQTHPNTSKFYRFSGSLC